MWPQTFDQRLLDWNQLRQQNSSVDFETLLTNVNNWWWRAPIINHHLHWEDAADWPDPWQLLADDQWCDVARALGIVYTIIMIRPESAEDIDLIQTNKYDNLVSINKFKYILNWAPGEILNNLPRETEIKHCLNSKKLYIKLG
jgi:hypothetical protein